MMVPFIPASPEWHALRAQNIGASEIAALFGCQAAYALSHYALWQVKSGRVSPPEVNNERAQWGLRLEEAIAAAVAQREDWTVTKGAYVTDDTTPGLGCTLDYVAEASDRDGPGALELKNTDWMVHRRAWVDGEPPLYVLLQHQAQLACTGWKWGAVACLVGGNDLHVYPYEARPKLIAEIRLRVADFWRSIEEGREPPVDGSDGAAAVLRALYERPIEEELDLSNDNAMPDICARLLNAAAERKAAEAREKLAKNELIAKLQGHTRALAQGFRVSVAVTPEKPSRPAEPGEVIPGRAEARRYNVREVAA
jgi:putative phage-type endonuclease